MSVRQTITFTDPQMKWLKKQAKALGITVSDMIRRVIDSARARVDNAEAIIAFNRAVTEKKLEMDRARLEEGD